MQLVSIGESRDLPLVHMGVRGIWVGARDKKRIGLGKRIAMRMKSKKRTYWIRSISPSVSVSGLRCLSGV